MTHYGTRPTWRYGTDGVPPKYLEFAPVMEPFATPLKPVGRPKSASIPEGPNCRFIRKTPSGSVLLHVHDELDVEVVRAQINGQWCWAYLDAKTNTLAVHVGDAVGTLDVQVQDELGNLTTFTTIL